MGKGGDGQGGAGKYPRLLANGVHVCTCACFKVHVVHIPPKSGSRLSTYRSINRSICLSELRAAARRLEAAPWPAAPVLRSRRTGRARLGWAEGAIPPVLLQLIAALIAAYCSLLQVGGGRNPDPARSDGTVSRRRGKTARFKVRSLHHVSACVACLATQRIAANCRLLQIIAAYCSLLQLIAACVCM